jgi:hypothetical protein
MGHVHGANSFEQTIVQIKLLNYKRLIDIRPPYLKEFKPGWGERVLSGSCGLRSL